MNQLLKDAIADAKAVRETALANAKVALEEAFAPKLQSMLSHKIKEEMEDEEMEMAEEEPTEVAMMQKRAGIMAEEDEEVEAEEDFVADEDEVESEEEMDFEDEVAADDEMEAEDEMDFEAEEEEVSDEDLEEILRELEGEDEEMEMEAEDPEAYDMKDEAKKKHKMMEMEDEDEEEIDLEEIIQALNEEDEEEVEEKEEESAKEELEEAYSVIKFLRAKLNEVNLLNAKLLFVNKLFKKNDLNETQKVKIIETFDRAKNVREAKLIYATLSESVNKTKVAPKAKRVMNEGFASAPQKNTQIIAESNNLYNRFKTLVDYNKK